VPAHFNLALLIQPMLFLSLALVAAGIGLGVVIYRNARETDPLSQAQPALFRFLENKMWLDELYEQTVVACSQMAARLSDWMDRYVWDGIVRAFGSLGQLFGILSDNFDERGINAGVDEATTGTRGLGRVLSGWHSGQIQTYLRAVGVSVLALVILYAWLI
jgi:NADH:ubiquinone oxidoreductase subunit 5 (subunit L)/multisubunit Na+/H+ antiporter MnhA subunit